MGGENGQVCSRLNQGKSVLPMHNPSLKNSSVVIVWFGFLIKQFKTTSWFCFVLFFLFWLEMSAIQVEVF